MKYMLSFQCDTHEEAQAVLAAVTAIGKEPHACSKQYMDSKELLKNTLEQVGVTPSERKNVSPGEPSITKIGSATKETIVHALNTDTPLGDRYHDHLKLLWKRGEIKFDGKEYYL